MGKQGPCFHCGAKVSSQPETPLWRNGPPDKPVLCNACGSRWRIRGSLENYIPKRGYSTSGRRRSRKMSDVMSYFGVEKTTIANPNGASDESEICTTNGGSISQSVTSDTANLFDTAAKSESHDRDAGITDAGKQPALSTEDEDDDEELDPNDELPHITMLKRDLLNLYEQEKSSMVEEDVLVYDVVNPFMYENEIGFGSFLLKPPVSTTPPTMEEASGVKHDQSASSSLTKEEETTHPPAVIGSNSMDKSDSRATIPTTPANTAQNLMQFPNQEQYDHQSMEEIFPTRPSFAPGPGGPDSTIKRERNI